MAVAHVIRALLNPPFVLPNKRVRKALFESGAKTLHSALWPAKFHYVSPPRLFEDLVAPQWKKQPSNLRNPQQNIDDLRIGQNIGINYGAQPFPICRKCIHP